MTMVLQVLQLLLFQADWGTIEWSEGSGSAHAGSSYDVTSPGTSGGVGDAHTVTDDSTNVAVTNGLQLTKLHWLRQKTVL